MTGDTYGFIFGGTVFVLVGILGFRFRTWPLWKSLLAGMLAALTVYGIGGLLIGAMPSVNNLLYGVVCGFTAWLAANINSLARIFGPLFYFLTTLCFISAFAVGAYYPTFNWQMILFVSVGAAVFTNARLAGSMNFFALILSMTIVVTLLYVAGYGAALAYRAIF